VPYQPLNVNLSHSTAEALRRVAAHQGTTVTALVEALAECFCEAIEGENTDPPEDVLHLADVVTEARAIAARRRDRTPET
jgi:hypothetical protein